MSDATQNIQAMAKKLLKDRIVDTVIGFKKASLAYLTQPFIARTADDVKSMVFNCSCRMNLTNFLPKVKGKTAVIVKGCDSRNLVTQIMENRVQRDQVHIIGVPCAGMANKRKLLKAVQGDIVEIEDQGAALVVQSVDESVTIDRQDILQENCKTCISRNPVIYDELAGPKVPELKIENRFSDVESIEAMGVEEKQAFFDHLFENCIRCYACRNACPLCFCPTCFVDESRPQWVGKTTQKEDVKIFHLLRAFHDAGRCTDCGACEAACPMDIRVRTLTRKTIRDCVANFQTEIGMDEERRPVLDRFNPNDPQEYIL